MRPNSFEQLKTYLIPVLSIIVAVAMVPLFIFPQLNQIVEASKIINKNKERLDNVEKKAEDLEKLSENKEDLDDKIKTIEQALPVDKSVAQLVSGIQQLAISSGLKVLTLKIVPGKIATESAKPVANSGSASQDNKESNTEESTPKKTVTTASNNLLFQITLEGGTAQFRTFLTTLEKAKRILVLDEFKSESGDGILFKFDIYLQAPFVPLPKLSEDQIGEPIKVLTDSDKALLEALDSDEFQDVTQFEITPGPTGVVDPFQ